MSKNIQVDLGINANVTAASSQLKDLQKQLQQISNMKVDIGTGNLTADIEKASEAAMKLSAHLATAMNPQTGNLDFTKFYTSIQKSGASLQEYGEALQRMGPAGQKAFVNLANSISKAEIPLKRTSQMVDKMWDGLKRTASWQLQSTIIHGIIGSIQSAVGYAKDLNSSLNDIRIVTGQSTDQMAKFAKEANQAAKSLSTTTTDYTKASLIYYQQGLSDAEVKQRTETTIKMANVSGQSAEKVSSQMTAIWNNYDNGSKSLEYYGDVITALGAKTASSSEEIAQGIQKFAAVSDTIGLSYEYAASALATVTATTRESADVVGNAYKTLFSRIQGLQLGETLEDGTDLNKYSAALAKVGINIKDASGQMKDMDNILSEMGMKWQTLSKDQQFALAQTVAGVRQYTQLIALMDHWDYFQENLNVANQSKGTLDTQAAIYAESWEAASNRVRASWEGLWDNLISSDGFINILNGLSGFIDILDQMITGMGGAGGALLTFGGVLTTVFNKQIASGISDVAYGIKMLFPSQQQKAIDTRSNLILEAKDIIASDTELMSGKMNESRALNFGLMNQLESSLLYSVNKDKMSAMQKFNADIYNKQMELSAEQRMKISKQADDSARARADFYMEHGESDINFLGQTSVSAKNIGYKSSLSALETSKNYKIKKLEKLANIQNPSDSIVRQMDQLQGEIQYLDAVSIPNIKTKQKALKNDQSGLLFDTEFMSTGRNPSEWNSYKNSQLDILESQQKDLMNESQKIREKYSQEQWDAVDSTSIKGLSADKAKYKAIQNQVISNQNRQDYLKGINIAEKGISSYSQGLINQATSLVNLQNTVNAISEVDSELSEDNITNLANALKEFNLTATHNMKGSEFLNKLTSLSKGDHISDIFKGNNLSTEMAAFANASMDQLLGNVYDTLYSSNEAFREKYADISKKEYVEKGRAAYLGTAQAEEEVKRQYQRDLDLAAAQAENYEKGDTKKSSIERLISGASGAMELAAAGQAVQSFTTALTTGSATLSSGISSIISVFAQGASGISSLLTAFSGLSAGLAIGIPAILGAVTLAVSVIKGIEDGKRQLENERNEKTIEETEAIKDRLNANKALIKSMNDSISAYDNTVIQYNKGQATLEEKNQAQNDLIKTVQESSDNYSPQVISNILSGDTAAAERQMYQDRSDEIQREFDSIQVGKNAAGELLIRNSGMFGLYGDYAQKFLDTAIPTLINSGWNADKESKDAVSFLEKNISDIIPKYTNENGIEMAAIHFGYGDAINLNHNILTDPDKFVEVYDILKNGLTAMAAAGYSDTDFYGNLEKFITNNAANVEKYRQSSKDITDLQAEKAAIDAEFFAVDNLQDYSDFRQKLIAENSQIEGFQEQLDIYLNSLSNLQNTEQGNLPAIYKALEGAQQDTIRSGPEGKKLGLSSGLNMQTMINLYDSMGNDLFSINFGSMTTDALSQFKKAVESIEGDLAFEAIITAVLQNSGVNSELMSILRSAQALADANTIKINLEIVSNFDPETDLFDSKKRQEFLDAYNEIMGNQEGDNDYIDSNDLSLMTSDDITDMQFRSTQQGRSQEIANAQRRVQKWTNIAEDLKNVQAEAASAETKAYDNLMEKMGDADTDFSQKVSNNAGNISKYNDLQKLVETDEANLKDIQQLNELRSSLHEEGLVDEGGNLKEGIPEAIAEIDALAEAQNNLAGVNEYVATATSELASAQTDSANVHLAQQELIQKEAEYYNVDIDAVRRFAKELADSGRVTKQTNETTEAFNNRLLQIALDYQENSDGLRELQNAYEDYNSAMKKGDEQSQVKAFNNIRKAISKITKLPLNKVTKEFFDQAKASGALEKALKGDVKAIKQLEDAAREAVMLDKTSDMGKILDDHFRGQVDQIKNFVSELNAAMEQADIGQMFSEVNADLAGQIGQVFASAVDALGGGAEGIAAATALFNSLGIGVENMGSASADMSAESDIVIDQYHTEGDGKNQKTIDDGDYADATAGSAHAEGTGFKFFSLGGGASSPGGGGGGGGGGKEPKKVANKRKSQTVKRYKRNDAKRSSTENVKKSEENKKDYLYGESKIAQMEKINKLAEKEAKITSDRIKESRTYLIEDRENLIKYLQKYGYEAEFDADGFLANYEQVWTDVYEQIAALYEDNLLSDEEAKIEEDLNVMLEELEGALEDYENSLSELQSDIDAYEETLFEMYDNKVEALEHKVEFKIELSEDDLDYLDFWIESLGDNIYNALEAIEAMGEKANALFDGLETYQQGIVDIMSLSDDPLQIWATGGIEGILTQDQIDALRDNRDGLADYMQQLIDLRDEIKDKVLDTFDDWQEKLDSTLTTIEHYTSVLEHFKNMIDVVGKDSLGLSNQFMANLEQNAINQSLDSINANKAYYDNLVEIQQEAQEKLEEARARGDQSSADHWKEIVKSTTEAMQDAQDALLTSLEDSLNLIAEQFETNMERAIEAFNDAIYAYGGLEGLSSDYDRIRENADLMAADYEKIYELSKITRNINKTLDDTNIIAGKQKLISLQKEINNLQNSGVELSKYDLEYLQAKYELRLAEIELENAQNAKDTVRLSRDSEGNWSYIYTQNADAVEEAGQKYEDALYEMQKLSQEYLEEMSSSMLDTSSAMMEEISGLRIQDFNSYEEYQAEIKRIQDKYAESLKLQESELNKAVSNSQQIYEQDWRNYNLITGYKISESEKWIDAFKESTIGQLLNSDTIMSSFSDTFLGLTEVLTKNLADSAVSYFTNIDKAFDTYGTSIENFGKHIEESTKKISDKSKEAAADAKTMATDMNDAFKQIADTVADWQKQFSGEIDNMLDKIKTLIQDINEAIRVSANLQTDNRDSSELIGQNEAIDLLNERGLWGTWGRSDNGTLTLNGNATTFTDFNGELIQKIDDKMTEMFNAKTGSEERSKLEEEVKELFKQYYLFKDIVGRIYDVTDLKAPTYASMDTGGYTGEWGDSGKFAMLHEKELVLNKDDTKNFLDALNLSKDIINSMIEMNAKQSSLALGNLAPTSIQDMSQVLEQSVTIQAEFPNATDHSEIEEAFNNLINTASQYANRRK